MVRKERYMEKNKKVEMMLEHVEGINLESGLIVHRVDG